MFSVCCGGLPELIRYDAVEIWIWPWLRYGNTHSYGQKFFFHLFHHLVIDNDIPLFVIFSKCVYFFDNLLPLHFDLRMSRSFYFVGLMPTNRYPFLYRPLHANVGFILFLFCRIDVDKSLSFCVSTVTCKCRLHFFYFVGLMLTCCYPFVYRPLHANLGFLYFVGLMPTNRYPFVYQPLHANVGFIFFHDRARAHIFH